MLIPHVVQGEHEGSPIAIVFQPAVQLGQTSSDLHFPIKTASFSRLTSSLRNLPELYPAFLQNNVSPTVKLANSVICQP